MSDTPNTPSDADAELQREILAGRKFSLAEAVGRMAGGGLMKGASPVTAKYQAEAVVQDFLCRHLTDAGGALGGVLLRRVRESDLLLAAYDRPLAALAGFIQRVLGSEYRLEEFVREVDVEWGRETGERPHFQRAGCPPDPDDPYTFDSVRTTLTKLAAALAAGET